MLLICIVVVCVFVNLCWYFFIFFVFLLNIIIVILGYVIYFFLYGNFKIGIGNFVFD